MPDIHIERAHALGLAGARQLALRWAEVARDKLSMDCTYQEGENVDRLSFSRPGLDGELQVSGTLFLVDARLGLLLGAFKGRIESEIVKNLDLLLADEQPLEAFEKVLARRSASRKVAAAKPKAAPRALRRKE